MPTYEYECGACGHTLEELQDFADAPLKKCPKCQKKKLERLISGGAGFIFKGDGFYETDYRDDSYKESAKKDKGPEKSKSDKKTDSKTETKKEPADKKNTNKKKKKD
jgi:putative FmdB family regulatory protein